MLALVLQYAFGISLTISLGLLFILGMLAIAGKILKSTSKEENALRNPFLWRFEIHWFSVSLIGYLLMTFLGEILIAGPNRWGFSLNPAWSQEERVLVLLLLVTSIAGYIFWIWQPDSSAKNKTI